MAAIADSGGGSEKPEGGAFRDARWLEHAVRSAEDLKQAVSTAAESAYQVAGSSAEDLKKTVTEAADSALQSAGSSFSWIFSASSETLEQSKVKIEWAKKQCETAEELAVTKIKEGIIDAALHPALSCGIAAGLGILLFKRPRRFLIRNTRRIFVSEESLLSSAKAKVMELQQSVNMVTNESRKLEVGFDELTCMEGCYTSVISYAGGVGKSVLKLDRATRALEEVKRGQRRLMEEGRLIQRQLNDTSHIEKQIMSLKGRLGDLPKADASRFKSEVSTITSHVKQEKKALNGALSRIINHGIPL